MEKIELSSEERMRVYAIYWFDVAKGCSVYEHGRNGEMKLLDRQYLFHRVEREFGEDYDGLLHKLREIFMGYDSRYTVRGIVKDSREYDARMLFKQFSKGLVLLHKRKNGWLPVTASNIFEEAFSYSNGNLDACMSRLRSYYSGDIPNYRSVSVEEYRGEKGGSV